MSQPYHPKCGKRFPGGPTAGHCATCCNTFIGITAYDAHLSRNEDGSYVHANPANEPAKAKWWAGNKGNWHKGDRLTEEQKASMFGDAA